MLHKRFTVVGYKNDRKISQENFVFSIQANDTSAQIEAILTSYSLHLSFHFNGISLKFVVVQFYRFTNWCQIADNTNKEIPRFIVLLGYLIDQEIYSVYEEVVVIDVHVCKTASFHHSSIFYHYNYITRIKQIHSGLSWFVAICCPLRVLTFSCNIIKYVLQKA